MRWLRWEPGRLGTRYDKLLLATSPWPPFDLYLLRFAPGAQAPPHLDEVPGHRHFRLNVVLRRARAGGEFVCSQSLFRSSRVVLFRPDQHKHSVSEVTAGTRYVLSFGWLRKAKLPTSRVERHSL